MSSTSPTAKLQRIGVLLCIAPGPKPFPVQLLDTAAVDLFSVVNPGFLRACRYQESAVAQGREYEFLYIAEKQIGGQVPLSSELTCVVTHTLETAGHLDILYVPGPSPGFVPSEAMKSFIRQKFTEVHSVLSVCTGIFPLARSGVLSGLEVTATRAFLPVLRAEFPDVIFVEKRWVSGVKNESAKTDEGGIKRPEVWTSGGIMNGIDLVYAYLKTKFPPEVTKVITEVAEVTERSQDY